MATIVFAYWWIVNLFIDREGEQFMAFFRMRMEWLEWHQALERFFIDPLLMIMVGGAIAAIIVLVHGLKTKKVPA
ncbi:Hypothetical protein KNT65_gp098 [Escherichia phage EcS1]|uniref:Uncharacterized protein n=1 Tax=Escherichia phage EcS1 TaxID=2083276 RepID=A0A2Z5ZCF1_9CAUD|nr:Hypothetical protein KNT65_gp098 [Escherichia phage EcS1]BBC78146.1 Hypothetical protein [Escherichia phage EcS1]